jgi:hypothetical protein
MKIFPAVLYASSLLTLVGASNIEMQGFHNSGTRVFSIPRGGGWLSDTMDESTASAKAKAKDVYDSASSKTADAVAKAKANAEKSWLKRVDDLEARLKDETAKASVRLEKEQKRLTALSEKEQKKLLEKIDKLQRKLEEQTK